LWLAFIGLFFLWGLYAAYVILSTGLGMSNLDNYFGFGLWITFDLAVIALGAGAFFTGLIRYIIRIDELAKIINLTVIIGFICYSGAMLVLTLDSRCAPGSDTGTPTSTPCSRKSSSASPATASCSSSSTCR